MDFLKYWWNAALQAFDFSKGIVEMICFLLLLFVGLGGPRLLTKYCPKTIARIEDIPGFKNETQRSAIFFLVLFMGYLVAVGPYLMHKEQEKNNETLRAELAQQVKTNWLETVDTRRLDKLEEVSSKRRLLSQEDIDSVIQCLSNSPVKCKVFLRPSIFDSSALEYASQLESVFTKAAFETLSENVQELRGDSALAWGFTGERLYTTDIKHPPRCAIIIQKCFIGIGRTMPGAASEHTDSNMVIIAIGGRP